MLECSCVSWCFLECFLGIWGRPNTSKWWLMYVDVEDVCAHIGMDDFSAHGSTKYAVDQCWSCIMLRLWISTDASLNWMSKMRQSSPPRPRREAAPPWGGRWDVTGTAECLGPAGDRVLETGGNFGNFLAAGAREFTTSYSSYSSKKTWWFHRKVLWTKDKQGDFWMKNCDLAARNEDDSETRLSIYDRFNWGPKPGIRPGNDRWLSWLIGYLLGCINLFDGGYGGMSFWDFALNHSVEGTWWIPWFLVSKVSDVSPCPPALVIFKGAFMIHALTPHDFHRCPLSVWQGKLAAESPRLGPLFHVNLMSTSIAYSNVF